MNSSEHTKFSLIVPVYNREDEVEALLESLAAQDDRGCECIIVEDGSTAPCREVCDRFQGEFDLK